MSGFSPQKRAAGLLVGFLVFFRRHRATAILLVER
jgi:hypothetical protein